MRCAGMCEASFNLGMLHMQGDGVQRDLHRARDLFRRGTEQNDKNEASFVFLAEVEKMILEEEGGEGEEEGRR
jgi:TPR repeat protein